MKTLYIFDGIDNVCITKGNPFLRYESHNGVFYKGQVKHKGIFGKTVDIQNLRDIFLADPKKLLVGDKFVEGWQVIKVKMDYHTKEPYIPDVSPQLLSKVETLQNEVRIWQKKFYDIANNVISLDNKDRFDEEMKRRAKMMGDVRSLMYGYSGYGGDSPFMGNRFGGFGLPQSPPPGGNE